MTLTVGIVGLGGMGAGVARRLLDQGHAVAGWNRSPNALEAFDGQLTPAATPAEAAAGGLVVSFVANDEALAGVTEGPDGILAGLPDGGLHVSMSSVSPDLVERLEAAHRAAGRQLVGAPVFGRPEAAAAGRLWIALSGDAAARARATPMLETISQSIHVFGDAAATALKVKIAGNFLIASAIEAMSEAFAMLERNGADPRTFHEMMSASIFGSVIHQNYGRIILDEAFTPPGFKLALGRKDVGLARDLFAKADLASPFADTLWERFTTALEAGHGEEDWNALSTVARG